MVSVKVPKFRPTKFSSKLSSRTFLMYASEPLIYKLLSPNKSGFSESSCLPQRNAAGVGIARQQLFRASLDEFEFSYPA